MPDDPSLLDFPCDFTFKVIGKANLSFEAEVLMIIRQHFPNLGEGAIKLNTSSKDNYLALTITVLAQSQDQLDNAYRALSQNPNVIFVL